MVNVLGELLPEIKKKNIIQINKISTDDSDTMECSVGKYYSLEFALMMF